MVHWKLYQFPSILNNNIKLVIGYNFLEGVIMRRRLFSFEPNLFSIEMITLLDQTTYEPQIQFKHELGS